MPGPLRLCPQACAENRGPRSSRVSLHLGCYLLDVPLNLSGSHSAFLTVWGEPQGSWDGLVGEALLRYAAWGGIWSLSLS